MPLFALICRDKPGALQIRQDNRADHLEFLKTGQIFIAGPLIEDGDMRGSLVVIEAEDLAAARTWAAGDPYAAAGLFESVQISEWKKVIG
ncbi:hypothetical protein SAMN04489858_11642 [Paracoccus homiensis]|uniref:YCII-related domain-containing protein n=2 Tax=Paracoccus homiensis TaxID=364199 RepID=A0A1I0IFE9_9RHOB|nr:hypothetical protein SAMN04489858_11642 [Paracoccus homiensis]